MSGYRQSSFDPAAYSQAGRPMRPFNWVQWTGVAFEAAALTIYAIFIAGELGYVRPMIDNPVIAMAFLFPGIALINSRRYPPTDPVDVLQRDRNRRVLLITTLIIAIAIGAAAVIQFSGA